MTLRAYDCSRLQLREQASLPGQLALIHATEACSTFLFRFSSLQTALQCRYCQKSCGWRAGGKGISCVSDTIAMHAPTWDGNFSTTCSPRFC